MCSFKSPGTFFSRALSTWREPRRVVVTGMGVHVNLGSSAKELFDNMIAGKSGMNLIQDSFSRKKYGLPENIIASELRFGKGKGQFDIDSRLPQSEVQKMSLNEKLLFSTALQAVDDAKWMPPSRGGKDDPLRCGLIYGCSFANYDVLEKTYVDLSDGKSAQDLDRYTSGHCVPSTLPCRVMLNLNLHGPATVFSSACASGVDAALMACRSIQLGETDVMLAGGGDSLRGCPHLIGFMVKKSQYTDISKYDSIQAAACPFDKSATGISLGDGSAFLLLEEKEHALKRGARIYAEVFGYGKTNNAHGMYAPTREYEAAAMSLAIKDANLQPDDIQYANPHGTGTRAGDACESLAIKDVFGEYPKVSVSATKSSTSHIMSGAGAVENIISVMVLNNGIIPPTLNLKNVIPEGEGIDFVPNFAKRKDVKFVINSAFGFGGLNASIIFGHP